LETNYPLTLSGPFRIFGPVGLFGLACLILAAMLQPQLPGWVHD
jgi:hypothetical protein